MLLVSKLKAKSLNRSRNLTYKEKIEKALDQAQTLEDIDYIYEKINKTDKINRRTKAGRELTKELNSLYYSKVQNIIKENNITPF